MNLFLDTSALVKRYVAETGSGWVASETAPSSGNRIWVSSVIRVEAVAAFRTRVRMGTMTAPDADTAEAAFRGDVTTQFLSVPVGGSVLNTAAGLVRRHPLRTYDAIQLATAVVARSDLAKSGLPPPVFVSADAKLNAAAAAEGFIVEDPNAHP